MPSTILGVEDVAVSSEHKCGLNSFKLKNQTPLLLLAF